MLISIFLKCGSQIQDRESYSLTEFTYPHIRIEQIFNTQDLLISGAPSTIGYTCGATLAVTTSN